MVVLVEQQTQADPTCDQGGWGHYCWQANPIHLEVVSEEPWSMGVSVLSQTIKILDSHWLQTFISVSLCIEMASNDVKPHRSASTKRCYSVQQTLKPSLCFLHTLTLRSKHWRQNLDSSLSPVLTGWGNDLLGLFLGRPLPSLSLTSPVMELGLQFADGTKGSLQIILQHQHEVAPFRSVRSINTSNMTCWITPNVEEPMLTGTDYQVYWNQEALLQQRKDIPNANFFTFWKR